MRSTTQQRTVRFLTAITGTWICSAKGRFTTCYLRYHRQLDACLDLTTSWRSIARSADNQWATRRLAAAVQMAQSLTTPIWVRMAEVWTSSAEAPSISWRTSCTRRSRGLNSQASSMALNSKAIPHSTARVSTSAAGWTIWATSQVVLNDQLSRGWTEGTILVPSHLETSPETATSFRISTASSTIAITKLALPSTTRCNQRVSTSIKNM